MSTLIFFEQSQQLVRDNALVGERVGRGTLYLYELVGECVYLSVGRERDGHGKVGHTDWGKDVVPNIHGMIILEFARGTFPKKEAATALYRFTTYKALIDRELKNAHGPARKYITCCKIFFQS